MLFRCMTLRSSFDGHKVMNGTQQLKELLQESTPTDSRFEDSHPAGALEIIKKENSPLHTEQ